MSKYPFFAKKGRPSSAEREVCRKINKLVDSGSISENDINEFVSTNGVPETQDELETLYSLLTGEEAIKQPQNTSKYSSDYDDNEDDLEDDDIDNSFSEQKEPDMSNKDANPIDFTPFEEPVIEREYTKGFQAEEEDVPSDFQNFDDGGDNFQFNDEELKRPVEEEIPEPEWAGGMGGGVSDASYVEENSEEQEPIEDEGKLGGDNLQDLSPQQKRKSAEKTAEAILNLYCNFAPLPFKKWASFSDAKVNKLVFEDKLDMNMQLENNVTVRDYIKGTNEQVEEIFEVSDETREEIKDPLIDVLLEQDLALTPTQRLLFAVGGHVLQMGFSAYQLAQNNKIALESFQKYHEQFKSQSGSSRSNTSTQQAPPMPNEFNAHEQEEIANMIRNMEEQDDDVIDSSDPSVEVTEDYD
jgi:hypothetical protein